MTCFSHYSKNLGDKCVLLSHKQHHNSPKNRLHFLIEIITNIITLMRLPNVFILNAFAVYILSVNELGVASTMLY